MKQLKDLSEILSDHLAIEIDKSLTSGLNDWFKGSILEANVCLIEKNFPDIITEKACDMLGINTTDLYRDINLRAIIRNYKINSILKEEQSTKNKS
jgi:hypothetical protein